MTSKPPRNSGRSPRNSGTDALSLELHVLAFGDVRAETGTDDDAAADLSRVVVAGPHRVAALAEKRIGVRRLGFSGVERIAGIVVEDARLFHAAAVVLGVDHFLVVAGQRDR